MDGNAAPRRSTSSLDAFSSGRYQWVGFVDCELPGQDLNFGERRSSVAAIAIGLLRCAAEWS